MEDLPASMRKCFKAAEKRFEGASRRANGKEGRGANPRIGGIFDVNL